MAIEFPEGFWDTSWTYRRGAAGELGAAILAAGFGKRLDPLTARHLPKPMFPLGGKVPIIETWVRKLVASGIRDVSMNLCVHAETIKRHFHDDEKYCARIHFAEEDTPSGTFGGVCAQALGSNPTLTGADRLGPQGRLFNGSTLIVPSGDIVTNFGPEQLCEMYEIHKQKGAAISIVLVPVPWEKRRDYGTVILDAPEEHQSLLSRSGRIIDFREKDPDSPSNLNNASIYLIEMDVLRLLDPLRTPAALSEKEPLYDFGKHVFPAMLGRLPYLSLPRDLPLWGIQYDGSWFDIGQKRDYLQVNEALLKGELCVSLPYEQFPWGYLGTNVTVDFSRVTIRPPVVIGNDCVVEPNTTLGPFAVIGDGWNIESGAEIKHSVLWQRYSYFGKDGTEVPAGARQHVDQHEVGHEVSIDRCIVAGGAIESSICEKTVDALDDGSFEALPIDYIPSGPRA